MISFILKVLIISPLLSFIIIFLIPKDNVLLIKRLSLLFSILIFFYCIELFIILNLINIKKSFIKSKFNLGFFYNIDYSIGIDGISILFLLLMSILIPICLLVNWESIKFRNKDFILILFLLEFLVFNIFCSLDIFFFFFFF